MKRILAFLFLAFVLAACTASGDADMTWISDWTIDLWMTPRPKEPVSLAVAEVNGEHRLFLRRAGENRPAGTLERRFGEDIPVKGLFLEVDGNRFLVFFVEAPLASQARSIMIYRPDPDFPDRPDLSRKGKIIRLDRGFGLAPVFPAEASGWTHLTRLVVTARNADAGSLVDRDFNPPLSLHFVPLED